MLEVMKFKDAVQGAVADCRCRFQAVSDAQSGNGWKRCRVDYQRESGRHERVFIYLHEKSSDQTVRGDVMRAIRDQEQLLFELAGGVAESA